MLPRFEVLAGEGGKVVEFVFNRRTDNTALIYEMQISMGAVQGEHWRRNRICDLFYTC